jgi:nucleotide-binding universal stress UspA family protein
MTKETPPKPPTLVAAVIVDPRHAWISRRVIEESLDAARAYGDTTLHVLTVIPDDHPHDQQELEGYCQRILEWSRDAASHLDGPTRSLEVVSHARTGDPVAEILDIATNRGAIEVYVGAHERSLELGHVIDELLDACPCPVTVVSATPEAHEEQATMEYVFDRRAIFGQTQRRVWSATPADVDIGHVTQGR